MREFHFFRFVEIMFLSAVDEVGALPPTPRVAIDSVDVPLLIESHLLSKGLIASGGPGVQPPVECPE